MPYFISALVLLTIGIGLGWGLSRDDDPAAEDSQSFTSSQSSGDSIHTLSTKIDELTLQLENERQHRVSLENDLIKLRKLVTANITQNPAITAHGDISNDTSPLPEDDSANIAQANTLENGMTKIQQALIAVGMDGDLMERIEQRVEKQEMQQLYLQNQARREGWYGTSRYFEEQRKADSEDNVYREELGDERYDKFLFETGQNNRVTAYNVLSGSPAEKVGMQANDIVYSYNDKRIFSWDDLTRATAEGDPQQVVRIEVIRDGEPLEFYLKRGPLGIRLGSLKVNP